MNITKSWIRQISISLFVVLLVVAVISGCASYKPGLVYKEWTRTMSQEGIFPIFPPREDVQVGDVWLLPSHPFETGAIEAIGGLGLSGIWSDNIAWEQEKENNVISTFYKNRPLFPSTSKASASIKSAMGNNSSNNDYGIVNVPRENDPSVNIYGKGDIRQLRQVAFPEFSITNIDQFAMSALVPIEVFNVAGGFTNNKIKQISLKIPSAESYGIPAELLIRPFLAGSFHWKGDELWLYAYDYSKPEDQRKGIRGINKATASLARSQFDSSFLRLIKNTDMPSKYRRMIKKGLEASKDYVWVALVNEVFYARAIDINIRTKKARGGGVNVQPITNQMIKEVTRMQRIKILADKNSGPVRSSSPPATPPAMEDTGGRDIVGTTGIAAGDDAFKLASDMNKYVTNLGNQSVPGVSVNLVSVSDASYGLRRIYDRPIAVGVRGVILQINVKESTEEALMVKLYDF